MNRRLPRPGSICRWPAEAPNAAAEQAPRYLFFTGKGGVGKTAIAAAIAVELARLGHRVRLSTTDPAAHVDQMLPDPPAGLEISRIDPKAETRAYVDGVLAERSRELSAADLELLKEDLRSPCIEEIAVFHAVAREVSAACWEKT